MHKATKLAFKVIHKAVLFNSTYYMGKKFYSCKIPAAVSSTGNPFFKSNLKLPGGGVTFFRCFLVKRRSARESAHDAKTG
jgi:hypothetical protein